MHFRSDVTEVLSKKRHATQRLADLQEQVVARPVNPAAIFRRRVTRWNLPELVESAEVIQSDVVAVLGRPAQPLNPPFIAALLHHVPTVERISPTLSSLAEKIWRHARYNLRLQIVVQPEQLAVRPHVGAVVIHKDCDIAHNADRPLGAVPSQRPPLLVESKLQRAANLNVSRQFMPCCLQRCWLSTGKVVWPPVPAF